MNTREKGEMNLFQDHLRGEISNPEDMKLKILLKIADMAEKMILSKNILGSYDKDRGELISSQPKL